MSEVVWYGKFINTTKEGAKSPKYTCVKSWGIYNPMESLKGRDGRISFYLLESTQSGSKESSSTPPMKLQAKASLNLTGLKNYYIDGRLSGYAYGNAYSKATYGKDNKINPFGANCKDGFLFRFQIEEGNNIPKGFEMLVIPGVSNLVANYCQMLQLGGFNSLLDEVRKLASDDTLSPI